MLQGTGNGYKALHLQVTGLNSTPVVVTEHYYDETAVQWSIWNKLVVSVQFLLGRCLHHYYHTTSFNNLVGSVSKEAKDREDTGTEYILLNENQKSFGYFRIDV